MLEESKRPDGVDLEERHQTREETLESGFPCMVSSQCQPTEPGETSQISSEPFSRAAATWEASRLVARATTGEGFHSTWVFL